MSPARRRSLRLLVVLVATGIVGFSMAVGPFGSPGRASASPLSSGDYTAYVGVIQGGSPLASLDAETLAGAAGPGSLPANGVNAVAVDPRAEEILASVGKLVGSSSALLVANASGLVATVPLGLGNPGPIAVSPDGSTAWVGDWNSGQVDKVDLAANPPAVTQTIQVPSAITGYDDPVVCTLAASPDGSHLYVGATYQQDPIVVRAAVERAICAPESSYGVALFAYDASGNLDGSDTSLAEPSGSLSALQVAPDSSTVYAATSQGVNGQETVGGTVTAVTGLAGNTPVNTPVAFAQPPPPTAITFVPPPTYADAVDLALTPDGSVLYIADNSSRGDIISEVPTGGGASQYTPIAEPSTALAVTPDAKQVLVTAGANVVSLSISSSAPVPANPVSSAALADPGPIAITPDQAPVAALNASPSPATTGVPVAFTTAGSSVQYGGIASYEWNFGDGSPPIAAGPTVSHTYATPGTYTVTVTETDTAGTSVPAAFPSYSPFGVDLTGQTASRRSDPSAQSTLTLSVNPPPTVTTPTSATTIPPTTQPATTAPPTSSKSGTTPGTSTPGSSTTGPSTTHPSGPTTTRPPSGGSHQTGGSHQSSTSTSTTMPPGVTTTTLPLAPPGAPDLTVDPTIGPPGLVAQFSGQNFPPGAAVTVAWSPGIGSTVVTASPTGSISGSILIMYRDQLGDRTLFAAGYPTAVAAFLVVPDASQPAGSSSEQFLYRR